MGLCLSLTDVVKKAELSTCGMQREKEERGGSGWMVRSFEDTREEQQSVKVLELEAVSTYCPGGRLSV